MSTNFTPQEKINIFKGIFKGREDIFAKYWEKADKSASGYSPVCLNEWKRGICDKTNKKKCHDCQNQNYALFDDKYVEEHLRGYRTYGIYPLLKNNSSYFIAVDFDGDNWQRDSLKFYKKCKKHNLPAYIERSRSGNGGHVWMFFANNYPAYKSRNIIINILRESEIIDQFDKDDSFDRIFPNQDILSGKGFGNLIALPIQGEARKQGNSIFLDPVNNLEPYFDQWDFLSTINKIEINDLDNIYNQFNTEASDSSVSSTKLIITLKEQIYIHKKHLPKSLIDFLRDGLNFTNSDFLIKKRMGISTYGMEKYFKLVENLDTNIAIPRGFLNKLVEFLNESNIKFTLLDQRNKNQEVKFRNEAKLYNYQKVAVEDILSSENGILVAPPGCGKTIIGIEIISRLKQPALILVHKKQIFNQWLERIENFLSIPKREIGQICSNKKKIGGQVTVAMVQTLNKMSVLSDFAKKNSFGLIIVDECHHVPAKMFRHVITNFNPYYLYGLTATPTRKNNDEKLIFIYLGDILHTIEPSSLLQKEKNKKSKEAQTEIIIKKTNIEVPFKVKIDNFQVLSKIITYDSNRNGQIAEDIDKELNKNKQ